MSRSGYSDDCENIGLWRSAVDRATFGKRGQAFFKRLVTALDAMPVKRLITGEIVNSSGDVCALGAVDPVARVDPEDCYAVGEHFRIAPALAAEIAYMNDERFGGEYCYAEGPDRQSVAVSYRAHCGVWTFIEYSPEERWSRMRAWAQKQIYEEPGTVDAVDPSMGTQERGSRA